MRINQPDKPIEFVGSSRLTDRSRKVLQLAEQVVKELGHKYVGTEHILIALVREGSGVAANVLKNLDVAHLVEKEVRDFLGLNDEDKNDTISTKDNKISLGYCPECKVVYADGRCCIFCSNEEHFQELVKM